MTQTMT